MCFGGTSKLQDTSQRICEYQQYIDKIVCTFIYVHMNYIWDPEKDAINRSKHGVSFKTAALVFDDPFHLSVIDRVVEGEERWRTMGQIGGLVILVVAHTYKEQDGEETIRIISARKATRSERRYYERQND